MLVCKLLFVCSVEHAWKQSHLIEISSDVEVVSRPLFPRQQVPPRRRTSIYTSHS